MKTKNDMKKYFNQGIIDMGLNNLDDKETKIALLDIDQVVKIMLSNYDDKQKISALKSVSTINALAGYIVYHCNK